jgi:type II secretory pathway component GspD/PulD (secretin)
MILKTTEPNLEEIKQLVEKMDVPSKQVCVETKFMELNDHASTHLGIRWDSLEGYQLGITPNMEYMRGIERQANRLNEYTRSSSRSDSDSRSSGTASENSSQRYTDINGVPIEQSEFVYIPDPGDPNNTLLVEQPLPTTTLTDTRNSSRVLSTDIMSGETRNHELMDAFSKTIMENQAAILEAGAFELVLSALKKTEGISIISNPKIIVASGSEDAFFSVGDREPIVKTEITRGTQDSPGDLVTATLDTQINTDYITDGYLETGINLKVIPVVKTEEMIEAQIMPRLVRRVLPDKVVGNNSWPRISVKEIKTKFTLRSGQTVAIGGLTDTSDDKKVNKIPFLGDIPLLGKYLFSHTQDIKSQVETIIFVTLALAEAETLYREAGIPEGAELVHKRLIESKVRRQKFEDDLQQLRTSSEIESAGRARSRLLRRRK